MVFDDDGEITARTNRPPPKLSQRDDLAVMVLSGPDAGQYFIVHGQSALIGRHATNEIALTDGFVSRTHARLERSPDGTFSIRDEGSRFGLYMEGRRITEAPLEDGVRVQLSTDTVLRVRYQDPRETELLDQLHKAAMTDALTSVVNRRYLIKRLRQEISFSRRHKTDLSVLLIDLDQFKQINDRHGHLAGDRVLQHLAERMARTVRGEDVLARYGGDEFAVIVRGYPPEQTLLFANRLCAQIREQPFELDTGSLTLTLSIGLASFDMNSDLEGVMELLARADAALYRAKASGRDQAVAWTADLSELRGPDQFGVTLDVGPEDVDEFLGGSR